MPDRKVIAQEFVNLKNRVRNEMRRRNGYGSMVSYADAKYDFKNSALPNTLLRLEYMTQNQKGQKHTKNLLKNYEKIIHKIK